LLASVLAVQTAVTRVMDNAWMAVIAVGDSMSTDRDWLTRSCPTIVEQSVMGKMMA